MIAVTQDHLFTLIRQQEIQGCRIFDMEENLVFVHNVESTQKSKDQTKKVIAGIKQLTESVQGVCKVCLKKFNNTKPDEEIVYRVRLGLQDDTENKKDPQMQGSSNYNIEGRVKEEVAKEMNRMEKEKEVEVLKAEIAKLRKPFGRALEMSEKMLGIATDKLIQGIAKYAENSGMVKPNLQGEKEDQETIIIKDKKEMTEEEKFEQAVQILFDLGVTGDFLLALSKKVKEKPELLNTIQKILDLPKLKNNDTTNDNN